MKCWISVSPHSLSRDDPLRRAGLAEQWRPTAHGFAALAIATAALAIADEALRAREPTPASYVTRLLTSR